MNKALEVIEARWLFDLKPEQIEVLIHPQCLVHAVVEFRDGSALAQLAPPDMRLPIGFALSYPERWGSPFPRLDLARAGDLTFEAVDPKRFPALTLGWRALKAGGTMPAALNAANEVAVGAFLEGRLGFTRIAAVVAEVMDRHEPRELEGIARAWEADAWARELARKTIQDASH
jgi:1-deoxy-D-xylulose-5-phosphate reductoisomerase